MPALPELMPVFYLGNYSFGFPQFVGAEITDPKSAISYIEIDDNGDGVITTLLKSQDPNLWDVDFATNPENNSGGLIRQLYTVHLEITTPDGTLDTFATVIELANGDAYLTDDSNVLENVYFSKLKVTGLAPLHDTFPTSAFQPQWGRFYLENPLCFTGGTHILTKSGERKVEDLKNGDLIFTADSGYQPILWIGSTTVSKSRLDKNKHLRPIRICKGSLGESTPSRDLWVSPQHRVLLRSRIAQKMFGKSEVLVSAKKLCGLPGIEVESNLAEVHYFHLLFARHEIVISNGAETESLYTGPEAMKTLNPEARAEILTLFPELADMNYLAPPVRFIPTAKAARALASRHAKNCKPLYHVGAQGHSAASAPSTM